MGNSLLQSGLKTMLLLLSLLLILNPCQGQAQEGLPNLDKFSIDKVLQAFEYTVVKFDVSYPTGDKHRSFAALSKQTKDAHNLLLAEVRIKDYGDFGNKDVAERFGVNPEKDSLPEIVVFRGSEEVARYGGDYTEDNLRTFISSKTGVYIKLEGCLKELDILAARFAKAVSKEERKKVLFAAESWAKAMKDGEQEAASVYVKLMQAAVEDGAKAIEKEKERVTRIMQDKASDKVKERMTRRLNVISSFSVSKEPKEEL